MFGALILPRMPISIHALREEGDHGQSCRCPAHRISIHALREEGDWIPPSGGATIVEFLSTPSARRATRCRSSRTPRSSNFYPRPPRGGRRGRRRQGVQHQRISIHALREEGDGGGTLLTDTLVVFLSTPSARRATIRLPSAYPPLHISIHALREEGDRREPDVGGHHAISIHALREEGDSRQPARSPSSCNFYPRPPRGGRQQKQRQNLYFQTNYTTFCTNLEEP